MASRSTPHVRRGDQHPAKTKEEVKQQSTLLAEGWASELSGRVLEYPHDVDTFIKTLLPCSTPCPPFKDTLNDAFSEYNPMPGKTEEALYPGLSKGLKALVAEFGDRKPIIFNAPHNQLDFPYNAFINHHHPTAPDFSVGFPGKPFSNSWQHISMAIEAKAREKDDPFPRGGFKNTRTVEQLAKNARNLMLTHGFLCTFVIGVYGNHARLVRFDHTCALVSGVIDLREDGSARTLRRFLWHFVNPTVGDIVSGCDPTVMSLSRASQEWVKRQLKRGGVQNWEEQTTEIHKGRRVEVYDQKTGRCIPYLLYHLVDVNGRLFSRATMVWRAIEDTRIWRTDRLVDDPKRPEPPKPQILKEAWRQLVRTAEATFYDRINGRISDEERYGIPKMVCGGDIGEFEFRWWEETGKRWGREEDPEDGPPQPPTRKKPTRAVVSRSRSRARASKKPKKAEKPSTSSPPTLFSSTGSASSPVISEVEGGARYVPDADIPVDYPQHQTYSWRLALGKKSWHRERSHMRIVIDDVGRPLTEFKSTHELVTAVRDAIVGKFGVSCGHRLLWEKAEILHRDVSVGNILIKDEKKMEDKFSGFLHDYDYSSMVPDPKTSLEEVEAGSESIGDDPELGLDVSDETKESIDPEVQKERTGTYYFMAVEMLKVPDIIHNTHHDLESFYWVLLWVVVRHTDHGQGTDICNAIFKYGNDWDSANAKKGWLDDAVFDIPNNKPLSFLLKELTRLVQFNFPRQNIPQTLLDYDSVLNIFNEALEMDSWPENDWKPCDLLKSDGRTGIAPIMVPAVREQLNSEAPIAALPTRGAVTALSNLMTKKKGLPPHPLRPHLPAPFTGPMTRVGEKRPAACLDDVGALEQAAANLRSDALRVHKRQRSDMGPPALPGPALEDSAEERTGRPRGRQEKPRPALRSGTRSSSRLREQKMKKA
ncbi:hypothetical protein C8Q79DRAFT_1007418 [Trametes meyenii]|nr:hypothetical protein C8Q79DRAFT_1007418 [Trametes meyenii]